MLTSRVLDGWWRARARVPRATRWKLIGSLLEKASPPSGTTSRLVATDPSPAAVLDTKALPQFPVFPLERHSETAIWMDGRQLTFGALSARSLALATIFAAGNGGNLALPKGATVGVIVETELEVPELFMACRTAGLKILPIPDVLHPTEVENTLQNMKLDALFCTSRYYGSVLARQGNSWMEQQATPVVTWGGKMEGATISYEQLLQEEGGWDRQDAAVLLDSAKELCEDRAAAPFDDFVYYMTSGTTGAPKIVRHTHIGFIPSLLHFKAMALPGAKYMSAQNTALVSGALGTLSALYNGIPTVLYRGYGFDAREYAEAVVQHQPWYLVWTPMIMDAMSRLPDSTVEAINSSNVKSIIFMGASFPLPLVQRVVSMFPRIAFVHGYGSTEVGSISALPPDKLLLWLRYLDRHPELPPVLPAGVMGGPLQVPQSVSMIDLTTGEEVPPGLVGSIVVNTAFGSNGYFNAPEAQARLFQMHGEDSPANRPGPRTYVTGDRGRFLDVQLDAGSSEVTRLLVVAGRESEVIVTARGFNVDTAEVVNAVSSYPGLDLGMVAVGGVKVGSGIEEICCWIAVPEGQVDSVTADSMDKFLRSRLADYKIPKHFRFMESLPVNANGKIEVQALRRSFVL